MDIGQTTKTVLLTGAGISHNWGGKLATELWGDLLGHSAVQQHESLRQLLLDEPSFETAIARCRTEDFSDVEREALETALIDAYIAMDEQLASNEYQPYGWINVYGFQKLLNKFCYSPNVSADTAYIFTLNQDLLLERYWYNFGPYHKIPIHPGIALPRFSIRSNLHWFGTGLLRFNEDQISYVNWTEEPSLSNQINYIKLHGSFNWMDSEGGNTMVIGNGKARQIADHPLLNWYSEVFKTVLNEGAVRLMVIGYSFSDEHINAAIAEAVENHGLRLFVWDVGFDALRQRLLSSENGKTIYNSLISNCTRKMIEVFPSNQIETEEYKRVVSTFFS